MGETGRVVGGGVGFGWVYVVCVVYGCFGEGGDGGWEGGCWGGEVVVVVVMYFTSHCVLEAVIGRDKGGV